jgi:hypothetical protein
MLGGMTGSPNLPGPAIADAEDNEDHDRGLAFDLPRLLERRRMLKLLGGARCGRFPVDAVHRRREFALAWLRPPEQ